MIHSTSSEENLLPNESPISGQNSRNGLFLIEKSSYFLVNYGINMIPVVLKISQ